MSPPTVAQPALPPAVETALLEAVKSLQYGSVEVTVHYSRVVQVECTRKIRFASNGATEPVIKA